MLRCRLKRHMDEWWNIFKRKEISPVIAKWKPHDMCFKSAFQVLCDGFNMLQLNAEISQWKV